MDIIKQFARDMIHMTEGERLINYWWLWLGLWLVMALIPFIMHKIKS